MTQPESRPVLEPSDVVIETPGITAAETAALTAVLTAASAEQAALVEAEEPAAPNAWQRSLWPQTDRLRPGPDAWRRA